MTMTSLETSTILPSELKDSISEDLHVFSILSKNLSLLTVVRDPWETTVLKRNVGKIHTLRADCIDKQLLKTLTETLTQTTLEYVTWRVSSAISRNAFEKSAFEHLENIKELIKTPTHQPISSIQPVKIYQSEDVANLCTSSFKISRFHTDPEISTELAKAAYRSWAINACNGTAADVCLIASENEHDVDGFITAKKISKSTVDIGLIAVSEKKSGQGLGKRLVKSIENWCVNEKIFNLTVKTQSDNLAALKLYKTCGFQDNKTYSTYRWHQSVKE